MVPEKARIFVWSDLTTWDSISSVLPYLFWALRYPDPEGNMKAPIMRGIFAS